MSYKQFPSAQSTHTGAMTAEKYKLFDMLVSLLCSINISTLPTYFIQQATVSKVLDLYNFRATAR